MVGQFNSFRGRLGRLFGGVPFYVGHPDLPGAAEIADSKAYGWIMEIDAREDGLYGQVKWSDAGLELLRNAHYKFYSPYWEAREIGAENRRKLYRPIALISVGLTNQPNIPVRPLANETKDSDRSEKPGESDAG
jgi:phage I-like protein